MTTNVHFVSPGLDYERFARPLNRGDPPADKVHLYHPPDSAPFPNQATQKLRHQLLEFDLDVTSHELDSKNISSATNSFYEHFLDELAAGNTIYINVTSSYHQLGTAAATAASFVIGDLVFGPTNNPVTMEKIRDNIHLYATEPERYHFEELIQATERLQTAISQEQLDQIRRHTNDLQKRVRQDRQTMEALTELFDTYQDAPDIGQNIASFIASQTTDEDIEELANATGDIFVGIQSVFEGMEALSEMNIETTLEDVPLPPTFQQSLEGVDDLLTEIKENESDQVNAGDMLRYFQNRLRSIDQILRQLGGDESTGQGAESLLDQLERARPEAEAKENGDGEEKTIFTLVKEEGIASGVRKFDGHSYQPLPGPLEFDLNSTSRAILYTLAQVEESESVQALTKSVIHDAIQNAPEADISFPDEIDLEPFLISRDPGDSDLLNRLLGAIQSTVQYNLGKLDKQGYIVREPKGQTTSIRLRKAGSVYVASREFDAEWRGAAYEKLCSSINDALEERSAQ